MNFDAQLQHAVALHNANDLSGAMDIYARLLRKNRKNVDLMARTAIAALGLGDDKQAKTLANQIIKQRPDAGFAYNILGLVEMNARHFAKALAHFERAVKFAPQDAQSHINLGEALSQVNRAHDAIAHLRGAVRLAPNLAKAHYALGVALKGAGETEAAVEAMRAALERDPLHTGAWKSLAFMGKTDVETDAPALERAAGQLTAQPIERAKILFALFATYESANDYARAFDHLDAANRLVAAENHYDVSIDVTMMQETADVFQPDLFERFAAVGDASQAPIFIVGMPRSGTTLIEQVLAGHSAVHACGELSALEDAVTRIANRPGVAYPRAVETWKKNDVKAIARAYLDALKVFGVTCPRFTDKMPENFLFLGVIALAFPKARIIHCHRDPVDTCLANYRQMLSGHHPQTYDQGDLVRYYKAYEGLMAHWRAVLGEMILDVRYEDVVADPETQAKRALAFCALEWEPACLDIANTKRTVHTASAAQVRDGIHGGYVERWRRYAPYIKTLTDGLA